MDIALGLGAAAALIALNAFFVAAEFSLVAVDRNRLEQLRAEGNLRARVACGLLERLSFHLSGAQLGITITSLVLGFVAEPTIARALHPVLERIDLLPPRTTLGVAIGLALVLATGTQMVTGELIPKGVSISRPMRIVLAIALPVRAYGIVFGPVIQVLNGAANWTVRRVGIEPREELSTVRSLEELEFLVHSSVQEGTLAPDVTSLFARSMRFRGKRAADALVPRNSVLALRDRDTVADLAKLAAETGYSRFPVRHTDIHDIVGVAHAKDVFRVPAAERASTPVTTIARPPPIVPETRDLASLFVEMRAEGNQLAVIVDEHGSTAGIITLEDILEEIVGDIEDEYDEAPGLLEPAMDGTGSFAADARLHTDEVAERIGFDMPPGDYHTLAGFLLSRLGHIPEPGERLEHDGWTFEVLQLDGLRIASVRITPPEEGETEQ